MNYIGWVSPYRVVSFSSWIFHWTRDSHGEFKRIFGFEFSEYQRKASIEKAKG